MNVKQNLELNFVTSQRISISSSSLLTGNSRDPWYNSNIIQAILQTSQDLDHPISKIHIQNVILWPFRLLHFR